MAAGKLWREASSYAELCELGARFLEGDLDTFPGWGADDTDEETDEISGLLAAWCRRGFLTVASQPGEPDGPGHDGRLERRRAFVTGFVDEHAAERLASLSGELLVILDRCPDEMPLGLRGEDVFLALGPDAPEAELALFEQALCAAACADLRRQRWACVVDPTWGRVESLWSSLAAVLARPYP
ncbi:MAG: hypothetical protein O2816_10390 [Planctomycetota bacterium]|nr:hypothetical protein [Planctomycetota bacterium]